MTVDQPDLRADAETFAEAIGTVWRYATAGSRARGGLPVLPPSQAEALRLVIAEETLTPTTLAARMNLSRPGVSEVIGKLEGHGLVSRRRSIADGRSVEVTATDRGRYVHLSFRVGLVDVLAEAFEESPPGDVRRLLRDVAVLRRLIPRLEAIAERASETHQPKTA